VAYTILCRTLIAADGEDSLLAKAIGRDRKGKLSLAIYCAAIPLAFYQRWIAQLLYVLVALGWLIPDRRIEKVMKRE